jgi:hypothetical protein
MDKISDVYKELKDRLANPVFFSFIISWCILNWKIVIGLIFYKINDLKLDGYISYSGLISKNLTPGKSFWYPLLFAILYTFLYPLVRNGIYAFQTWTRTWGDNWNLEISKTSNISISKYLELRDIYSERTLHIEKILKDESKYLNENEELRNKLFETLSENNSLKDQLNKWQGSDNSIILNGQWEYSEGGSFYKLTIEGNQLHFYDRPGHDKEIIEWFYRRPNSDQLIFETISDFGNRGKGQQREYRRYSLRELNDLKVLKGTLHTGIKVEFKRSR